MNSTVGFRFPTVLCALLCLAALTHTLLAACASTTATADLPTPTHTPGATSLPAVFFFRQKEEPNVYMQALMEGDLVLVDDCLRVGGAEGHVPIWPWDFALETDDSDVRVVGTDGRVVAQIGDRLRISGGEAPAMPVVEDAARPLLDNCPAPYWIVGNSIARVDMALGDPIAAGFGAAGYVFVNGSALFSNPGPGVEVAASLDDTDFFISGYWPGWPDSGAYGAAVAIHKAVGSQDMALIGFDALFRAHPENGFRMVANAIYNGLD
ncbi:MAG: hypothetical protein ACP5JJ_13560 [Anaerolineae bacterium]